MDHRFQLFFFISLQNNQLRCSVMIVFLLFHMHLVNNFNVFICQCSSNISELLEQWACTIFAVSAFYAVHKQGALAKHVTMSTDLILSPLMHSVTSWKVTSMWNKPSLESNCVDGGRWAQFVQECFDLHPQQLLRSVPRCSGCLDTLPRVTQLQTFSLFTLFLE